MMARTFINREWSLLAFHRRVLEEAYDKSNPLLERLKFLAISSSNMDELFMVRAASVIDQMIAGYDKRDRSGCTPHDTLEGIKSGAAAMVEKQAYIYGQLRRKLRQHNIVIKRPHRLSMNEKHYLRSYFMEQLFPVLTPMVVDQSRPFPLIQNKSLNIGLIVRNTDEEEDVFATVGVPEVLPRLVRLQTGTDKQEFILLEDVIKLHMDILFHGYDIVDMKAYRITRNADLDIDEEGAEDLLKEIEESLKMRKWGNVVRIEAEEGISHELLQMITQDGEDEPLGGVYEIAGPIDYTFLFKLIQLVQKPGLLYPSHQPHQPLQDGEDIFNWIRHQDRLLHHPFDSFDTVVQLVRAAAQDQDVLAIKQTLYRVSGNSPIIEALIAAAENKKQVTVLVELKARFDEENNIHWAKRLEQAGCHVIYGLIGLKTHLKTLLIVRREEDGIRRYVHLGTGNYNDVTAKLYTDMGLLTVNPQIGSDASVLFNMLSGFTVPSSLNQLCVAPLFLRHKLEQYIEYEIEAARKGRKAHIILKMNALVDEKLISLLYKASKASVRIELIVRGVCCLRPGVPNMSENITVRSIVGRFLEHTRIFYFEHGGKNKVLLSSADWMPRNLDRRVEAMFPIEHSELKQQIIQILHCYLADQAKSRFLQPDGTYRKKAAKGMQKMHAQEQLLKRAGDRAEKSMSPATLPFQPRTHSTDEQAMNEVAATSQF
ncbi:RNA degradosome polyphosphate kinase [Paenibacillaceae sp. P-4]|uniref:RNA degradosome polyphosphate kinase n=1 Tax=Paenibacillaceae bacterium P-4 TaxID=3160969 RepID=UPI0032E8150D